LDRATPLSQSDRILSDLALGRQFVDRLRQELGKFSGQFFARNPGLCSELFQGIRAKGRLFTAVTNAAPIAPPTIPSRILMINSVT
jgi:hypothetical protein